MLDVFHLLLRTDGVKIEYNTNFDKSTDKRIIIHAISSISRTFSTSRHPPTLSGRYAIT